MLVLLTVSHPPFKARVRTLRLISLDKNLKNPTHCSYYS
jgi:hypothetical protein